jgi:cytochrome c oxidase subunit 2
LSRRSIATQILFLGLLGGLAFLFSGCEVFSSPQNTFAPAGEVAEDQKRWFLLAMWPALAVFVFVQLGCLFIVLKFRKRKGHEALPKQVHGNNVLEIGWSIAPAVIMFAFIPVVIMGVVKLGDTPKDAITMDVYGVQWAWNFGYPAADGSTVEGPFGDPLVVPVGQTVELRLHSDNVIHSFWVPKLAGKTDVIPGRTNYMWFEAAREGTFEGQCAEFCGISHGAMRLQVMAVSREKYDLYVGTCLDDSTAAGCEEFAPAAAVSSEKN